MVDFSAVDRAVLRNLRLDEDATVLYTPVGGSQVEVEDVLFFSPDQPVTGADIVFDGVAPRFVVHREDVPNLAQDDEFERAGVTYVVSDVQKDETYLWIAHCREGA